MTDTPQSAVKAAEHLVPDERKYDKAIVQAIASAMHEYAEAQRTAFTELLASFLDLTNERARLSLDYDALQAKLAEVTRERDDALARLATAVNALALRSSEALAAIKEAK